MKYKTELYLILIAGLSIAVLVLVFFNWFELEEAYMRIFQKTGFLYHHKGRGKTDVEVEIYKDGDLISTAQYKDGFRDGLEVVYYTNGIIETKSFYKKGKLDGVESDYYEDGRIRSKEFFKNGKREGPKITYYENGQIEQSLVRKNDKDEGIERAYYDSGKLKYTRNWVHGKIYGNFYVYYEDGKVKIYHTYDILGDKFYISHYDESGKRTQSDGYIASDHTYSQDVTGDSALVLENNKSYSAIRDFYITVANPPDSSTCVRIVINNKRCRHLTFPDNNTAQVVNAFPQKGIYHISVDAVHHNKSNVAGYGTYFEVTVIRSH